MTRLLLLFAVVLTLALAGGPLTLAQETPPPDDAFIDAVLESMTTEEKVGQLFIVGLEGAETNTEMLKFIRDNNVGGVYLNREACNIINGTNHDPAKCSDPPYNNSPRGADPDTPGLVAELTQGLQEASCEESRRSLEDAEYCLPLFVSVDHEGDDRPLARLVNGFTSIPSNMAIGATFDPVQAQEVGCIVGRELAAVGINMLFGPDLDVLEEPLRGGPELGDQGIRVFGGDPRWVAEMGMAYVEGVHDCGDGRVSTVAKHLPGHGRSTRQVDVVGRSNVDRTLGQLQQVDLLPFVAVSQGRPSEQGRPGEQAVTDSIMTSHLQYSEVADCDLNIPVTFSKLCMGAFLEFEDIADWRAADGLIVIDDLGVGAVGKYMENYKKSINSAAEEALIAQNDVLLMVQERQWGNLEDIVNHLVRRYEVPAVKERVDDAVRRILLLKQRLYPDLEPAAVTSLPDTAGMDPEAGLSAVEALAAKSLTFVEPTREEYRSEPAPRPGERILFIECWGDPTCSAPNEDNQPPAYQNTWEQRKLEELADGMFSGDMNTIRFSELGALLDGTGDERVRTLVEEAHWLVFAFIEFDEDGFPDSKVLKEFLGIGPNPYTQDKQVVVFAYNSPYQLDLNEMLEVDVFIASYSKTEASLRASLSALFQETAFFSVDGNAGGSLPTDFEGAGYVLKEEVKPDPEPAEPIQLEFDPAEPESGQEFTVRLAKPLLAVNGYRVPNDTPVEFAFTLPDGNIEPKSAETTDGFAEVQFTSEQAGEVKVTLRDGEVVLLEGQSIAVQGDALDPEPAPAAGVVSGGGDGGLSVLLVVSLVGGIPLATTGLGFALYALVRRRASQRLAEEERAGVLVTIAFTDIEGSTALTQRLGDAKAQELLNDHNRIVRDALRAHGGSEVKHTGDGIMASFHSASHAIEWAVRVQRAVAARAEALPEAPLRVRVGLNAGEPVVEARDLFGTSVQLASRICDKADAGQVLVSNVVRELAAGKGFLFSDIGAVEAKGFEEPVRLYEVRWREDD